MSGFLGIGHLPGEASAERAKKALEDQAQQQQQLADTYYKPALAALLQQYQNPNTAADQAQFNQAASNLYGTYNNSSRKLQQQLGQNGLGNSSATSNALAALWSNYGSAIQNAKSQQMQAQMQRSQQALQSLIGAVNPNAAAATYGQMYNNATSEYNSTLGAIAGAGSAIGGIASMGAGGGGAMASKAPAKPASPVNNTYSGYPTITEVYA